MFRFLTRLATTRGKRVLLVSALLCVVAGALGAGVQSALSAGGYVTPGGEAAQASKILSQKFRAGEPNLVVLVDTPGGPDSPTNTRAGLALTQALSAEQGVTGAASYWSLQRPAALRAKDNTSALVLVTLSGDENKVNKTVQTLMDKYGAAYQGLHLTLGGQGPAYLELNQQSAKDLAIAETIVTPLLLLLLVFIFRGVVAATMPLLIGGVSILGAMAVLRLLTMFTNVSVFAMNLTTALGLGLGIDYSLFVLTRFREEVVRGADRAEAIGISLRTAGRTVVFSALTVALSLLGLLVMPMYFLRSFAYAGVAVVTVACLATLVILPATLFLLGPRIDKWSFRRKPMLRSEDLPQGRWYGLASNVMRRPIPVATGIIAVLLILGTPFLHIKLSLADARQLPRSAGAHQVQTVLQDKYSAREMDPVLVVAPQTGPSEQAATAVSRYASALSRVPNVSRVDALTGSFARGYQVAAASAVSKRFEASSSTWLSVVSSVGPYGTSGQRLIADIKQVNPPWPVKVGGTASSFHDTMQTLEHRLPWTLAIIVIATFLLLFLLTGSVVLPLKALVLNFFSLSATFGSMVWVFQEGHLSHLLGDFTVTGAIVATIPVLMFCVAFGLSMDYEVFVLSRIKEEYDASGDLPSSVARGLQRTGGLVTAAASLMAIVMISFLLSQVTFMKLLGLGLALAIILDATVIRSMLVPALMRLMGHYNWWAPRPLKALQQKVGLSDG